MSVTAATHYIKKRVKELTGQDIGSAAGSPNKEFNKMVALGWPYYEKIRALVDMDGERFQAMLENRNNDDLGGLVADLQKSYSELGQLIQGIESIRRRHVNAG